MLTPEEHELRDQLRAAIRACRRGDVAPRYRQLLYSIAGFQEAVKNRVPNKLWPQSRIHHTHVDPRPDITLDQVLEWMQRYLDDKGKLPSQLSGDCVYSPGYTWLHIENYLVLGRHGLPGGLSISKLKDQYFGTRAEKTILEWADAHYSRNGRWPVKGRVHERPGVNWKALNERFRLGCRGCRKYHLGLRGFLVANGRLPQWVMQHKRCRWWLLPPENPSMGIMGLEVIEKMAKLLKS